MEIILDTNFLLEIVKRRIDFSYLEEFGKLVIPKQVLSELEEIAEKNKGKEKENANLTLQIIEKNKDKFHIIDLKKGFVDKGIVEHAEKNKVLIATIDKNLKRELKGKSRILAIKAGKKLELI